MQGEDVKEEYEHRELKNETMQGEGEKKRYMRTG